MRALDIGTHVGVINWEHGGLQFEGIIVGYATVLAVPQKGYTAQFNYVVRPDNKELGDTIVHPDSVRT